MVAVTSKTDTSASSLPLSIAPQGESESSQGTLSFSELLRGITSKEEKGTTAKDLTPIVKASGTTTKDDKPAQNGALIFSLSSDKKEVTSLKSTPVEKVETLLSLLHSDEKVEVSEVSPLKVTTVDKREAPSTLLYSDEAVEVNSEKSSLTFNPNITSQMSSSELKGLIQDAKQYLKETITSTQAYKQSEIDTLPKTLKGLTQVAEKLGIDLSKITLEEVKNSSLSVANSKESSKMIQSALKEETPLVKAQSKTTISTEQMVNAKSSTIDSKQSTAIIATDKTKGALNQLLQRENVKVSMPIEKLMSTATTPDKTKRTLNQLLQRENVATQDSSLSVNVSAPAEKLISTATITTTTTDTVKSLESLLKGDIQTQDNNSTQGKLDGLNVAKADSLEVKINEAKQMNKYLSQDIKTAIEDYKSPFTRVKVQLNPQRLGEVDLTIVQRGKNLHINLSSNNAAINTLAMNVNDLKTQLNNNGINNATLNFNNMSQGQDGSASQQQSQQNQQNRQQAYEEYNYFDGDDLKEEIVSSLEIVVPYYA